MCNTRRLLILRGIPTQQGLKHHGQLHVERRWSHSQRYSNTTRIETKFHSMSTSSTRLFSEVFQHNKDWNSSDSRSVKGSKWDSQRYSNTTRIETWVKASGGAFPLYSQRYSNTTRIETNIVSVLNGHAEDKFSEVFQHNKDWNLAMAIRSPWLGRDSQRYSNTTRIETNLRLLYSKLALKFSEVFQHNKDWNNFNVLYVTCL